MDFDKSKVYTALNADELEIGSKVIVADSLGLLKTYVEQDYDPLILTSVKGEDCSARFLANATPWCLAYLVEESKRRSLEWTDLKVGDIIRNNKEHKTAMVVQIDEEDDGTDYHIFVGSDWLGDDDFEDWVKVEEDVRDNN